MTRVEIMDQERSALAGLNQKYGQEFKDAAGVSFLKIATDMKVVKKILVPPKSVIPCSAELKELGALDPCLIVPSSLPVEFWPAHKSLAVGGQVKSIAGSRFAMSPYLIDEAWRAQGHWNGEPLPMLVSIGGAYKYLVKQKSFFFRLGDHLGPDIDALTPLEPDELDLKLKRFELGDDLSAELTLIVAEY